MKKIYLPILIALALLTGLVMDSRAAHPLRPGNPVISPAANSHTVPPTAHVAITYDEAINPATVSPQTFAVHAMQTGQLLQTLAVNGGTIELTPDSPFHAGELVHTSATTATLSAVDGLGPLRPTVWQFRVATAGGVGYFRNSGQALGQTNSQDVGLGDLDGDGDLDAFVANCGPSYIWLNDGLGNFSDSGQRLGPTDCSIRVSLGDIDRDGDLDAVNVLVDLVRVWFNDGLGTFTDSGQSLGSSGGTAAELGDLDGDGDLDLFYTDNNSPSLLFFNNGSGLYTLGSQVFLGGFSNVALGDLDSDGDLDAFAVSARQPPYAVHHIYLNDGTGFFASGQSINNGYPVNSISLGDLDRDGDLDAYFSVIRVGTLGPDQVWLNDGNGVFSDSGQRLGTASTNQAGLGDIDHDGDLDVVTAHVSLPSEIWINQGAGLFERSRQTLGQINSPHLGLGDLDDDGDIDLFLIRYAEPDNVWFNLAFNVFVFLPEIHKR